jgi:hypothetical protein
VVSGRQRCWPAKAVLRDGRPPHREAGRASFAAGASRGEMPIHFATVVVELDVLVTSRSVATSRHVRPFTETAFKRGYLGYVDAAEGRTGTES